jgi:hypothetical protein
LTLQKPSVLGYSQNGQKEVFFEKIVAKNEKIDFRLTSLKVGRHSRLCFAAICTKSQGQKSVVFEKANFKRLFNTERSLQLNKF